MIKKRWIILISILVFMVWGCTDTGQEKNVGITHNNESEENGDMELGITKEYLIENCGVTEEELKGVNLEEFLSYFSLNKENVEKYNIPALLKAFSKEKAKDKQNLFKTWKEGVCQISLGEAEIQKVLDIVEEAQVSGWEKRYEGTSEGTTGSFGWSLYLELENEKVYRYSGSGVQGKSTPDSWTVFEKSMKDMFGE